MQKVNIDNCYLVLISRVCGRKNGVPLSKKVKFTVVESKGYGTREYKDVFGNETYDIKCDKEERDGTFFINDNWCMLPIRPLIGKDSQYLSKGKMAKIFREPIIELTKLLYSDEINKILDFNFVYGLFDNNGKNKQKKLGVRRI